MFFSPTYSWSMSRKSLKGLIIPESEMKVRFSPSGGPGGQHANKANTRVELTWNVYESTVLGVGDKERINRKYGPVLRIVVDETRSQSRNREIAQSRLLAKAVSALESPKKRVATTPSKSAKARRVCSKKRRGELKRLRRSPKLDGD